MEMRCGVWGTRAPLSLIHCMFQYTPLMARATIPLFGGFASSVGDDRPPRTPLPAATCSWQGRCVSVRLCFARACVLCGWARADMWGRAGACACLHAGRGCIATPVWLGPDWEAARQRCGCTQSWMGFKARTALFCPPLLQQQVRLQGVALRSGNRWHGRTHAPPPCRQVSETVSCACVVEHMHSVCTAHQLGCHKLPCGLLCHSA